jgi:hypothetical protein
MSAPGSLKLCRQSVVLRQVLERLEWEDGPSLQTQTSRANWVGHRKIGSEGLPGASHGALFAMLGCAPWCHAARRDLQQTAAICTEAGRKTAMSFGFHGRRKRRHGLEIGHRKPNTASGYACGVSSCVGLIRSIPAAIRTRNLRLRRPTLYPIELRGRDHNCFHCNELQTGNKPLAEKNGRNHRRSCCLLPLVQWPQRHNYRVFLDCCLPRPRIPLIRDSRPNGTVA